MALPKKIIFNDFFFFLGDEILLAGAAVPLLKGYK